MAEDAKDEGDAKGKWGFATATMRYAIGPLLALFVGGTVGGVAWSKAETNHERSGKGYAVLAASVNLVQQQLIDAERRVDALERAAVEAQRDGACWSTAAPKKTKARVLPAGRPVPSKLSEVR